MEPSTTQIDASLPVWQDFLPLLDRLPGTELPDAQKLNGLLMDDPRSMRGARIRFVDSEELDDEPYEKRIFGSGRVSTRPHNWHDLFNALVWARFPKIKAAMNACHVNAWPDGQDGQRGPRRDALTLFDECGVIVFSSDTDILESISARRWKEAFLHPQFRTATGLSVCGHAMLEKYLSPYKSMTAKALLFEASAEFMGLPRSEKLAILDDRIADGLLGNELLGDPSCLSPLPLAGIPGWWPEIDQRQAGFYRDEEVFRPPGPDLTPAPVYTL